MNTYLCFLGLVLLGALAEGRKADSNTNDKIKLTVNQITTTVDSYFSNRKAKTLDDISQQLASLNSKPDQCAVKKIHALQLIQSTLKSSDSCDPTGILEQEVQLIIQNTKSILSSSSGVVKALAANVASCLSSLSTSCLDDLTDEVTEELTKTAPQAVKLIEETYDALNQLYQKVIACYLQQSAQDQVQSIINAACSQL